MMQAGPSSAHAVFATALQQHQAGHLDAAEDLYWQVLAADSRHADSLHLLGVIAYQGGHHDLAVDRICRAIAINPRVASYHASLGNALEQQQRLEEAIACYRLAIELDPDFPEAHLNLGAALQEQGLLEAAIACYRRAIELDPDDSDAHNNLGNALAEQGQLDEAVTSLHRALDLHPDDPEEHNNLGIALQEEGQLHEAVASYRRAIDLNPDYPEAHHNLAMALLALGDMAAGWEEYEWRWETALMLPAWRNFAQPQWRGEAAEGRTLLVHAEQGLGDTMQFCRYAPLAAASGLRVVMEVPKPLVRLLHPLAGVDLVVESDGQLPPFDLHCPMLSLPLAFGTTLATIPAAGPYLHAAPLAAASWRARLAATGGARLRVGLAWAGNPRLHSPALAAVDRRRSIALDRLAPLFDLHGVQFVSLQKDGPMAPGAFALTDWMDEMADFADTASLIAGLDLVISVDTAVAHLAAALGRPVWLLDRFDCCWRWLAGRRDSPWYPTLRFYRQPQPGDWESVIAEVAGDLGRLAAA
jgi:tetratricopeptide (TPR) repeat protein